MNEHRRPPGARLGLIGGLFGLIAALGLMALRIGLGAAGGEPLPWALPGDLVFGAVMIVPFALGLAALRWGGPVQRAAALGSAAILAAAAPYTLFSVAGFVLWPAAPVLLIAAVRAGWGIGARSTAAAVGLALLLAALNVGAFRALYLHEDGACWNRVREPNGSDHWYAVPYRQQGSIDASGFGVVETRCSSDTYSIEEMGLSAGLLALAVGAWWVARAGRG